MYNKDRVIHKNNASFCTSVYVHVCVHYPDGDLTIMTSIQPRIFKSQTFTNGKFISNCPSHTRETNKVTTVNKSRHTALALINTTTFRVGILAYQEHSAPNMNAD